MDGAHDKEKLVQFIHSVASDHKIAERLLKILNGAPDRREDQLKALQIELQKTEAPIPLRNALAFLIERGISDEAAELLGGELTSQGVSTDFPYFKTGILLAASMGGVFLLMHLLSPSHRGERDNWDKVRLERATEVVSKRFAGKVQSLTNNLEVPEEGKRKLAYYGSVYGKLKPAWERLFNEDHTLWYENGSGFQAAPGVAMKITFELDSKGKVVRGYHGLKDKKLFFNQATLDQMNEAGPFSPPPAEQLDADGMYRVNWEHKLSFVK